MKPIRNSAKAIIMVDGYILTSKNEDLDGVYYILPGGGQQSGETLTSALRRECREEIAVDVLVGDLICLREYIGKDHEFAEHDADVHRIEFMFACTLKDGAVVRTGEEPDESQVGFEWLPLDQLAAYRFYPQSLRPILAEYESGRHPVYLGNVN